MIQEPRQTAKWNASTVLMMVLGFGALTAAAWQRYRTVTFLHRAGRNLLAALGLHDMALADGPGIHSAAVLWRTLGTTALQVSRNADLRNRSFHCNRSNVMDEREQELTRLLRHRQMC
jgi:hypothetical protein